MFKNVISKVFGFIVTTALFFSIAYYMYSNEAYKMSAEVWEEFFYNGANMLCVFGPVIIAILWSIIKKRYLWIWSVVAVFMYGFCEGNDQIVLKAYLAYFLISYIVSTVAVISKIRRGGKGGSGGGSSYNPWETVRGGAGSFTCYGGGCS